MSGTTSTAFAPVDVRTRRSQSALTSIRTEMQRVREFVTVADPVAMAMARAQADGATLWPLFVRDEPSSSYQPPTGQAYLASVDRLRRLLALPPDWDSYGAAPVDPRTATSALTLVMRIASRPHFMLPSIVPTPEGGIQLEWHTAFGDMEIEITPETPLLRVFWMDQRARTEHTFRTSLDQRAMIDFALDRIANGL